ncbi:phosphatidylinositol-glycan biosynthesis class X protein [Parambassis ranga]|uniref:Phosphatidylinositol-glycan biosynthesis class X protein n=1 Tax=Parambassis ranga TaxID=210632 RepID=A0A6P7IAW2_9TELE|nr:phosphatidylinositol-glycan biosynthesis class X protein [Parambassis ranga]
MYFTRLLALGYLLTCHCLVEEDKIQDHCSFLRQCVESVSVELYKKGFHREVITTVELRPDVLDGVRVLLVYKWPRGVYVDPYQLASLSNRSNWQILVDSAIDLELPAHKTSGFATYVYPSLESAPTLLKVTIPIHGRYHEPSNVGRTFTSVDIEPPDILLRTEKCAQLNNLEPHTVVNAPCTVKNSSTCPWVQIQHQQKLSHLRVQIPVGDELLVTPVCGGTLLVTMACCMALSQYMWKHRII